MAGVQSAETSRILLFFVDFLALPVAEFQGHLEDRYLRYLRALATTTGKKGFGEERT